MSHSLLQIPGETDIWVRLGAWCFEVSGPVKFANAILDRLGDIEAGLFQRNEPDKCYVNVRNGDFIAQGGCEHIACIRNQIAELGIQQYDLDGQMRLFSSGGQYNG